MDKNILFSRYELARPVMGTIFLVIFVLLNKHVMLFIILETYRKTTINQEK